MRDNFYHQARFKYLVAQIIGNLEFREYLLPIESRHEMALSYGSNDVQLSVC